MKKSLMLIVVLFLSLNSQSQNEKSYHYHVEYDMLLNFLGPTRYAASLSFNKSTSVFSYQKRLTENDSIPSSDDNGQLLKIDLRSRAVQYIHHNKENNTTTEYGMEDNKHDYKIIEPIPIPSWTVSEETKKINQHNCLKATCSFRGRNYTAWFTTDIQTNFGPLKLNGLPGLILEVYDDAQEVILSATSIREEEKPLVIIPAELKTITREQFKKSIEKIPKQLEEIGKAITSNMDRNLKATVKFSQPRGIEMDYNFEDKR